jgi:hypothetical protein
MFGLDGTVLSTKASRHSKRRRFTANAELLERRELLSLANDNFIQGTVFVDNQHTGMPAAGDIFQSATLTLTGSDNSVRTTVSDPVTGQYLFDNLPAVDGSNNEITYTLTESTLPTGYTFNKAFAYAQIDGTSVSGNSIKVQFPPATSLTTTFAGVVAGNDLFTTLQRPGGLNTPQGPVLDLVGQLSMTVTPIPQPNGPPATAKIDTYCVGLFSGLGGLPYSSFTEQASTYFAAIKASDSLPVYSGQIGYLFNNFGTAPPTTNTTVQTPSGPVSVTPGEFTEGLQYAIWKLEYDAVNFTDPTQSFNDPNSILYIPTPPNAQSFSSNVYWTAVQLIKQSANQNDLAMVLNFDSSNPNIFGQEVLATNSFDFTNVKTPNKPTGSISGAKYLDLTGNGLTSDDPPLGGVTIDLFQDTDGDGGALDSSDLKIASTVTASGTGAYSFNNLPAGTYFVKEEVPAGFTMTTPVGPGYYTVVLSSGQASPGNNFADFEGSLTSGDAATIGFWANKNGQALLTSLNGGPTATNLATWLSTNFPNLFPTSLIGTTNQSVANYFEVVKGQTGNKVEAQVMAAAFAVYVTDGALAGNTAASYGFNVTPSGGTGDKAVNVGAAGSLLGLTNNGTYAIFQVLQAANAIAVNGVIDAGNTNARGTIEGIFDYINSTADINS